MRSKNCQYLAKGCARELFSIGGTVAVSGVRVTGAASRYGVPVRNPVFLRGKIPLNELLYKFGLKLARIKFVRRAIESRADLSEFRKPPTIRILAGVFLIAFSMALCWPVIVAMVGGLAWRLHKPWIVALGLPIYIFSHVCYISGMFLSGEKYTRIFFRWAMRCWVERLLSYGQAKESAEL
jgi:hypothetical protein